MPNSLWAFFIATGDIPDTGADVNFDVHLGAGANFRIADNTYLTAGYRWRHVSNADTHDRNSGVDYNQIVMGFSYSF